MSKSGTLASIPCGHCEQRDTRRDRLRVDRRGDFLWSETYVFSLTAWNAGTEDSILPAPCFHSLRSMYGCQCMALLRTPTSENSGSLRRGLAVRGDWEPHPYLGYFKFSIRSPLSLRRRDNGFLKGYRWSADNSTRLGVHPPGSEVKLLLGQYWEVLGWGQPLLSSSDRFSDL